MTEYLLTLAYSLAVLTYYLGALVYLLPIPWRGLKRWGPTLVYDGWASAALASCFYLILQVTTYMYEVLGASWDNFTSWTIAQAGKIMALIGGAALIKRVVGSVLSVIVGDVLSPLMWALGSTLFALELLLIIGEAVRASYATLIALGIMLYAVPFRITRGVGSGLIAFAIVFYVCLPLLPAFVEAIASSPGTSNPGPAWTLERLEVAFVRGKLLDESGRPVANALLVFKRLTGEEIASYVTGRDGTFDAGRPRGGLPLNEPFNAEAFVLGVKLPVTPNPINPKSDLVYSPLAASNAEYVLELKLENGEVLLNGGILVTHGDGVELVNVAVEGDKFTLSAVGSGDVVVVLHPNINITWLSVSPRSSSTVSLPGGLSSLLLRYHVSEPLNLTIAFERMGDVEVRYSERPMLEGLGLASPNALEDVGKEVSRLFFAYFLLPMGYLGVLSFVSASLARVIGGSPPKIPVRW